MYCAIVWQASRSSSLLVVALRGSGCELRMVLHAESEKSMQGTDQETLLSVIILRSALQSWLLLPY